MQDPLKLAENFVACVKRNAKNTYAPDYVDTCTIAHLQSTLQVLAWYHPEVQEFLKLRIEKMEAEGK
jgi:hypothetical protein